MFALWLGVAVVAGMIAIFILFIAAIAALSAHLKDKGEGLGASATQADVARLERKLDAAITANN